MRPGHVLRTECQSRQAAIVFNENKFHLQAVRSTDLPLDPSLRVGRIRFVCAEYMSVFTVRSEARKAIGSSLDFTSTEECCTVLRARISMHVYTIDGAT